MYMLKKAAMKIHIISNPRSGSTYLGHMFAATLGSLKLYNNEPFVGFDPNSKTCQDDRYNWTIDWQEKIASMMTDGDVAVKNHMSHLLHLDTLGLLNEFKCIKFDYTCALLRRNLVDTALSLALAQTNNQWSSDISDTSITLDKDVVTDAVHFIWQNTVDLIDNKYKLVIDDIVFYEDLTWDFKDDIKMITDRDIDVSLQWSSDRHFRPKKQIINNYLELYLYICDMILALEHPKIYWIGPKFYLKEEK